VHDLVRGESACNFERTFGIAEVVGELARNLHQENRVPEEREGLLGALELVREEQVAPRDIHRDVPSSDHRLQQAVRSVA
jgi:hypothetical protein